MRRAMQQLATAVVWIALGVVVALFAGDLEGGVEDSVSTSNDSLATANAVEDATALLTHAQHRFRRATHRFCERVNDGRRDTEVVRRSVARIQAAAIVADGRDELTRVRRKELKKLREPVPRVSCREFR